MKHKKTILRVLLGLAFFVFGLNGFLNFLPQPESVPDAAKAFGAAMFATGYFFPLVKGTEVICGLALLSGYFVPLALVVLAPITLNIVLFHGFLAPEGMYIQVAILVVHLLLGWEYRASYSGVLKAK